MITRKRRAWAGHLPVWHAQSCHLLSARHAIRVKACGNCNFTSTPRNLTMPIGSCSCITYSILNGQQPCTVTESHHCKNKDINLPANHRCLWCTKSPTCFKASMMRERVFSLAPGKVKLLPISIDPMPQAIQKTGRLIHPFIHAWSWGWGKGHGSKSNWWKFVMSTHQPFEFTLCVLLQMYRGITWTWQQLWSANIQFLFNQSSIKYAHVTDSNQPKLHEITIRCSTPSTICFDMILQHLKGDPKTSTAWFNRVPCRSGKVRSRSWTCSNTFTCSSGSQLVAGLKLINWSWLHLVSSCHLSIKETYWHDINTNTMEYRNTVIIDVGMLDVSC